MVIATADDVSIAGVVIDVAVAAPMLGVVKVGLVENTKDPLPVSSLITPASSEEVVAAN